jgi:peroxiredoxin
MRLKAGQKVKHIQLPSIDGSSFDTQDFEGKPYMISFFRFASCPFCNLRIHHLIQSFDDLGPEFRMIAIFDSPLDNLVRHTEKHKAPFPILADESNKYYKKYGIERSLAGMFKGMFFRMPTMLKSMFMGNVPLIFKGSLLTMPADFLIDKNGVIQTAYYGEDEGDHLPLNEITSFFCQ